MHKKLLKTTLFGFSKTEVCEHIARVNNEFNGKIDALNRLHMEERNEHLAKIANLENELNKYKQANSDIAQALFDAQQYAAELKANADKEYQAAINELRTLKNAETEKLNGYRDRIEDIKKEIVSFLAEISGEMTQTEAKTEDLAAEYCSEEGISV